MERHPGNGNDPVMEANSSAIKTAARPPGRLQGGALGLCLMTLLVVADCGGSDSQPGPPPPPDSCMPSLESIPYDALGGGTAIFRRYDFNDPASRDGLYLISATSRHSTCRAASGNDAVISPNGSRLAYVRSVDLVTGGDVYVSALDGTSEERISAFQQIEGAPAWSVDGSEVFYTAAGSDWIYNLYRQPAYGGTDSSRVQITHYADPCSSSCSRLGGGEDSGHLSVSPMGRVAFSTRQTIDVIAADGTRTSLYAAPAATPDAREELHSPAWSSDGTRLAFLAVEWIPGNPYPTRHQVRIYVTNADGTGPVVIANVPSSGTQEPGVAADPYSLCWGSDGVHLLFNVPDGNIQAHLWSVGLDGTAQTQITSAPGVWDLDVSCASR